MKNWIKNIASILTPKTVKNATNLAGKISDNKTKNNKIKLIILILALIFLAAGLIAPEIFEKLLEALV